MPHDRRRFTLERLEPRDVPAARFVAVGSDAGELGRARLVDAATGLPRYELFPFGTDFTGGVRVAAADVTGDGVDDLIAAPGAGGGPVVKVFDGVTGTELLSQLVFAPDFRGGLFVAGGDTNLDGRADVVVGAGEGGGPAAAVIDGASGATTASFFAYDAGFRGGVRVAAGDVDGDGRADVVAAAGPGAAPHVRAVSVAAGGRELASFFAYDPGFVGGVYVASADLDSDGVSDILTGTGDGGGPLVRGFHADGAEFTSFTAADAGTRTGVRVGVVANGYGADVATVVPGVGGGRFSPTGQRLDATGLSGGWVGGPAEAAADPALLWNQVARRTIAAEGTPAPAAARALAMVHLAVFEAVNNIDHRYQPYFFFNPGAPEGADPEAAALLAGERVLSALYPDLSDEFVRVRDARLALIPDSQARTDGLTVGLNAASFVTGFRSFDGSDAAADFPYAPGTAPGNWRPTPPDFAPFLLPGWANVTPFAIPFGSAFRPNGPPDVTSPAYAAALDEVRRLGSATSTERTADQTEAAEFWDTPAVTPAGAMNQIAEQAVRRANLDLPDSAHAFAVLNLAEADAGIAAWDAKLAYDFWRPVTAIREAATNGNPQTTADPAWTPLLDTPNHPDYVAEHATFAAAGAAVLDGLFGADFAFRTYSADLPGVTRSFAGFDAAATEAGTSRLYAGVHFPFSVSDGLDAGRAVGEYVLDNRLQPVT